MRPLRLSDRIGQIMSAFRSWKFWVGILVSAICIVFAFWNINLRTLLHAFVGIKWPWFFIAVIWVAFILYVRAYRWKFLLGHIKWIGTFSLFQATTIGFAVNNLLPARVGELVRSYAISKKENIKFSGAFATVVAERIYDVISFTFILVLFLSIFSIPAFDKLGIKQSKLTMGIALIFIFGVALIVLLRTKEKAVEAFVRKFFGIFSKKWADKLADEVASFSIGISHNLGLREILALVFISPFIWIISTFQFWMAAKSLGVDLGIQGCFMLMVAVLFGISVPASPGYVGTYHLFAMKILQALGYKAEQALSIAIIVHITNYAPQIVMGLISLKSMGLGLKEAAKSAKPTEAADSQ